MPSTLPLTTYYSIIGSCDPTIGAIARRCGVPPIRVSRILAAFGMPRSAGHPAPGGYHPPWRHHLEHIVARSENLPALPTRKIDDRWEADHEFWDGASLPANGLARVPPIPFFEHAYRSFTVGPSMVHIPGDEVHAIVPAQALLWSRHHGPLPRHRMVAPLCGEPGCMTLAHLELSDTRGA